MMRTLVLVAGLGLVPKLAGAPPLPVTFASADGVTLYADSYRAKSATAPVILLFHQAGSNKSEYAPIAPRLVELGFNALAVDQRSGGDLYPPGNQTVQSLGKSAPYLDVLHDMDAALGWAKRTYPGARVYACGSSYSASLAFAFAAKHPHDVAAIIAFSPGEYFADKRFVREAARHVRVPVFVDSAADPAEERAAREITGVLPGHASAPYVPKSGIHGASTLRDDRDPSGAAENWAALAAFLARVSATGPAAR